MDVMSARSKPHKAFALRQILKKATTIITNSEWTKKQVMDEGVPEEKILVCYPCPTFSDAPKKMLRPNSHEMRVLSVSRIVKRKGQDKLIEALHILNTNGVQGISLSVVGEGSYKQHLEKLIEEYGLFKSVVCKGALSDKEVAEEYARADVFAMPTRVLQEVDVEGFGIVYLDAALYGLPSIAGDAGGAPEAVIDEVTGLVVDGGDPQAIAAALLRLYENPALRSKLGRAGCERVKSEFLWDKQFKKYFERLST
jgi:glycosyltransferase involved in cell wall biosynthesis